MDLFETQDPILYGASIDYRCPAGSLYYGVNETLTWFCPWDLNAPALTGFDSCISNYLLNSREH